MRRWPKVHHLTGLCRSHIHSMAATELFPNPVKHGARASAWLESEISSWIADRIQESRSINVKQESEA
ncbi:AlpA family transcriptional regulator [Thalassolituus sp. C2-1]|uniref:helix-turn-helix transcriptional regulator n=1 Tax=Venatorbacter sp. C2-1 TaxID=2597518 RepID=UPI0011940FB5|nr:AlpA family phage regulatory protein [Thalassolituus sp. C2-1]TVV46044.1 AlpA family phage regulatory protein [Thalassolituus sp. C2-1]